MAIYHFRVKIHSRRSKASVAARAAYRSGTSMEAPAADRPNSPKTTSILRTAAYRSGGVLTDKSTGERHDFTRKRGIGWTGILAPAHAPAWVYNRQKLWNAVEASEKRKDARLAREFEFSLPREGVEKFGIAWGEELARDFVRKELVSRGMCVDIAIHLTKAADGGSQPHCHALALTRDITPDGLGGKRRDWDKKDLLRHWRAAWQNACNEALAAAGIDARIDHRTLEAQELDRKAQLYMGKAQHASDEYDFVRGKKQRQEDIRTHNLGIDLHGFCSRIAAAGLKGGPGAAILAGINEVVYYGVLPPGLATPARSLAAMIVPAVQRAVHAR